MNQMETASESQHQRSNGSLAEESATLPALGEIDREVRNWVRERPLITLGLAIVTGYVVGRIVSRI